jgi:hypothetical protein
MYVKVNRTRWIRGPQPLEVGHQAFDGLAAATAAAAAASAAVPVPVPVQEAALLMRWIHLLTT